MKKIKRYGNRKLYDTDLGHYITFKELLRYTELQTPFTVVCNKTKTDITVETVLTMRYLEQMRVLRKQSAAPKQLEMF